LGGEVIDSIIIMNYRAAVKAFFDGGGQLQLGVTASLAAGPLGRSAEVAASASNANHIAATYAYSASKGLFIGYSLEGSKISERPNTNQAYYGRPIPARDILTGVVPPTQDAARLYDLLNAMGAGPRPGLPFAPKSSTLSPSSSIVSPPQPYTPPIAQQSLPPPQQQHYHQPTQAYEEPPPPYDGPPKSFNNHDHYATMAPSSSSSAPPINDSKNPIELNNAMYNYGGQTAVNMHNTDGSSSNPFNSYNENVFPNDKKRAPVTEQEMTVVVAKYDFHSNEPTDLSFSAGDHIIVTKRLPDRQSWWEGEIGTKRGYFPANYTDEIDE
jgi:hypothetical protein